MGKASLALVPPEDRGLPDPLPALTERSIDDPGELEAAIAETAARGYAVDDEEASPGVTCLAVARRTPRSEVYAISATLLKSRLTSQLRDAIVRDLLATADTLFPPVLGSADSHRKARWSGSG